MGCLLPVLMIGLLFSLLANVVLGLIFIGDIAEGFDSEPSRLDERFYLGDRGADDKVAVIRVEGVISEFTMAYPIKQMELAAKDRRVKAVVLRIDSPGGTVTASDELYQCIVNLRDDNGRRFQGSGPKPVAVSMGGVAASGGYYIAAAGSPIAAEQTTITGSIGVFAALPNVAELAHENGVKVELVKAGPIKGSGSFFHDMTPEERQTWQDTVDAAYEVFLARIAAGRPALTPEKLRNEPVIKDVEVPVRDEKGNPVVKDGKPQTVRYSRVRADGGTFTAKQAKDFQLIDKVEDLPATIRAAATAAGLSEYKAVVYDRPPGLLDLLMGGGMSARNQVPDLRQLTSTLTPRLWYLAPTADGAILTAGK
jgi:protease-4